MSSRENPSPQPCRCGDVSTVPPARSHPSSPRRTMKYTPLHTSGGRKEQVPATGTEEVEQETGGGDMTYNDGQGFSSDASENRERARDPATFRSALLHRPADAHRARHRDTTWAWGLTVLRMMRARTQMPVASGRYRTSVNRRSRLLRPRRRHWVNRLVSDRGAITAEYAITTMAAVAFAGLLVLIMRSPEVRNMLLGLIRAALRVPA